MLARRPGWLSRRSNLPPNKGMKLTKLSAAPLRGRSSASCPRRFSRTRAPLRSLSPVFDGLRVSFHHLAGLNPEQRAALTKVRRAILAAAPEAEERISYGMPAFRLHGKLIAGFRAAANHCSYHPMSGSTIPSLAAKLAKYDTSAGTLRFAARQGLPTAVVRQFVRARIAEIE